MLFHHDGELKWICEDKNCVKSITNIYSFMFLNESCLGSSTKVLGKITTPIGDWELAGQALMSYFDDDVYW